jgi:hypothetical protein
VSTPRINVYVCQECHGNTVTVDVDVGVTPFFLGCKKLGCNGMAQSSFYPKGPKPAHIPNPDWEWYKPTLKQAKRKESKYPGTLDHVQRGGLLLRQRTGRAPVCHEASNEESAMTPPTKDKLKAMFG